MKRIIATVWLLSMAVLISGSAAAGESEDGFARASEALAKNDAKRALAELEVLADRGYIHPDVSYDRGIAYVMRARTNTAQPGDLGRAAAGFEEASRLQPHDGEAARALDLVRAEVARKRSRQDKNDTIVRPTLDRVVTEQFSPTSWSIAAIIASILMSIGLLLRSRPAGWAHIAGSLVAPIALIALLSLAPVAYFARQLEATTRPGVIVVTEAALQDENGSNTDAPVIPEATLVELSERRGENVFVRWGSYEGWLPHDTVRPLLLK
jgi:hypothetical protein